MIEFKKIGKLYTNIRKSYISTFKECLTIIIVLLML